MALIFGKDKKDKGGGAGAAGAGGGNGLGIPKKKRLDEKPVEEFVLALSSKAPVPGGGGAAALVGALAAALGGMVANLTIGREAYSEVEEQMHSAKVATYRLQQDLLALIQKDADAFEPLIAAYRMPKGNDLEIDQRKRIIEMRTKDAAEAPLSMMRKSAETIELMGVLAEKGSSMARSDAACGAVLAAAAMRAAWFNVIVNTAALSDRAYAARLESEGRVLLDKWLPEADRVAAAVEQMIVER
jgi:formiminotetrahydrofolate cyclodeaminase